MKSRNFIVFVLSFLGACPSVFADKDKDLALPKNCRDELNADNISNEDLAQDRANAVRAGANLDKALSYFGHGDLLPLRALIGSSLVSGRSLLVSNVAGTRIGQEIDALHSGIAKTLPTFSSTSEGQWRVGKLGNGAKENPDFTFALEQAASFKARIAKKFPLGETTWARDMRAVLSAQLDLTVGSYRAHFIRDSLNAPSTIFVSDQPTDFSVMRGKILPAPHGFGGDHFLAQEMIRRVRLSNSAILRPDEKSENRFVLEESASIIFESLPLHFHLNSRLVPKLQEREAQGAAENVQPRPSLFSFADLQALQNLRTQVGIHSDIEKALRKLVQSYVETLTETLRVNRVDHNKIKLTAGKGLDQDFYPEYMGKAHIDIRPEAFEALVASAIEYLSYQIVLDYVGEKENNGKWQRASRLLEADVRDLRLLEGYFTTQLASILELKEMDAKGFAIETLSKASLNEIAAKAGHGLKPSDYDLDSIVILNAGTERKIFQSALRTALR